MQRPTLSTMNTVPKQVTVSGYVWLAMPPEVSQGLVVIGNAKKAEVASNTRIKGITVPIELFNALPVELFAKDSHLVITANYQERDGKLPSFEAIEIAAYDGRETEELKDWY